MAASPATMARPPAPRLLTVVRGIARGMAMPVGSVIIAFAAGAVIVAVTGGNPFNAYAGLVCGGFGIACTQGENPALQISNTIVFTIPLIATGVAVALPFRAGLFNIGAEGQLLVGSVACVAIGVRFNSWPAPILLPMALLGGAPDGALLTGID